MPLSIFAAVLLGLSQSTPAPAVDGFVVCTASPTRPGSNRVALLNLSHGAQARVADLATEYQAWMRSDPGVAAVIDGAGIDPRLVRAQAKVECVWAKDQAGAEGVAVDLGRRLRADGIRVLPTNWVPQAVAAAGK